MLIFMMVIASTIMIHFYGTRLNELSKARLGVVGDARRALGTWVEEVRSAKIVQLGEGSINSFREAPLNALQQGNAIQIYASTNTNSFTRYFWDDADGTLKRITNGASSYSQVARYITNLTIFTSEDFQGNVLTNP